MVIELFNFAKPFYHNCTVFRIILAGFSTPNPRAKSDLRISVDVTKMLNGNPSVAVRRDNTASIELSFITKWFVIDGF
jgi:hypothetical protein